jgi:hypothetical protein
MRGLGVFERGMLLVTAGILVATVGAGRGSPPPPGVAVMSAAALAGVTVLALFVWSARLQRARTVRVRRRT